MTRYEKINHIKKKCYYSFVLLGIGLGYLKKLLKGQVGHSREVTVSSCFKTAVTLQHTS